MSRQAAEKAFFEALQDIAGKGQVFFFGPLTVVGDRRGGTLGSLEVGVGGRPTDGSLSVHLGFIGVIPEDRRQGRGAALMHLVTEAADRVGLPMDLFVRPVAAAGDRHPPVGKEKLRAFYRKFGFERVPGTPADYMERASAPMRTNGTEYRGSHRAPGPEENSPLWDVTLAGSFPDDVYSSMGPRYYGAGDGSDMAAWSVVFAARGRRSKPVKIYRAVPKVKSRDERIAELEAIKRYILKHGKVPSYVTTSQSPSAYYEMVSRSVEALKDEAEAEKDQSASTINVGDWVTLDRKYAAQHGESNLGGRGNYKILSKTVPASALWTDGNSIQEWGYYP